MACPNAVDRNDPVRRALPRRGRSARPSEPASPSGRSYGYEPGFFLVAVTPGVGARMKTWVKIVIPVVVVGAVGFGAVQATTGRGAKNAFTLVKVERGTITDKALATGQIVPRQEIEVKSQISGIVKECFADVGDRVTAGQPLFAIIPDPTPLELNEVERGVQLSEVAYAKASADFDRNGAL